MRPPTAGCKQQTLRNRSGSSLTRSTLRPKCHLSVYVGISKGMRRVFPSLFATIAILAGQNFKVDDVHVVGDLEYGQTSAPVECSGEPPYCAFVFNGQGDDRIEVDVSSVDGKAFVAIADGALVELTSGTNRVVFSLPKRGPDAETYYIVFRDPKSQPRRFTVALKKLEK